MQQSSGLKITAFNGIIKSSSLLFLASIVVNVCNLLFWLFMVRNLNPIDYGVLNALFSLFMILSLPSSTIQTVVAKFVAQLYGKNEIRQVKGFGIHFGKRVFVAGILSLGFFILFSQAMGNFLKISQASLVVLTGVIIFIALLSPLTVGILQGSQRFFAMSVNGIIGSFLKLILGAIFVILGFKVMGALAGFGLAVAIALAVSFFQIPREVVMSKENSSAQFRMGSVYQYGVPVFLSLLSWMILTNADVILVKHFFSPIDAGSYSVAQMVGKIILFLPSVIGVVLFPKISEAFSQGKPTLPLLKKGLSITAFLCVAASIFCVLFPDFVLKILTGKQNIDSVRLVPYFCVAMTFYAMVNQLVFFNLAVHRFRFTAYLLLATFLQLGLITVYHPDLSAVIWFLIINSFLLFLAGFVEILFIKSKK